MNHVVKRPGYNLNHLKDNIQDQGNLTFQEMIRNIQINQSKSKEVDAMWLSEMAFSYVYEFNT